MRQPLKATKDKAEKDTSSETKSETDKSEGSETQSLSPAPAQEVSKRHSTEKTGQLLTLSFMKIHARLHPL